MTKGFKKTLAQIWPVLLLGILLRLFLSMFAFHPDLRAFNLAGQLIGEGNILNLYDYLASCASDNPLVKTFGTDLFIYPPVIYLTHGLSNFLFKILFGNWIVNGFLIENAESFRNIWFNLHLLILKLPYFVFDLAGAYYITRLFDENKKKLLALSLWLFNPVSLYATYMMGQFDMIPAFFTILSLYFARKDKLYFSALALGAGAAFKLYPLFLLPPLLLISSKWEKRVLLLLTALIPYLLTVIPFISSDGFRANALLAGLTQKTMFAQVAVSGGQSIILFPLLLILFYIFLLYSNKNNIQSLWQKQFVILLIFFVLTHFHPQWLTWLTPFLIIELVSTNFKHLKIAAVLLMSFAASLFFFDLSLTFKIFAPLFPDLYNLPADLQGLGISLDINYYRSIIHSVFAAVAIYFILIYSRLLKHED